HGGRQTQLALDRHRAWLGKQIEQGDVALLVAGGSVTERKSVDGAGQGAPLAGQRQRGIARAVVGAVAENEQAAQVALVAELDVAIVQHLAEVGALAVSHALEIEVANLGAETEQ